MKALILAAGLGKRLGLKDIPKPMYKVSGLPVLEHNILLLKKHGITDICINLHYKPEIIKDYFKNGEKWNVKITYSLEETLLGTGGAVRKLYTFWEDEPFFVVYGDNYTDINLTEMLNFHKKEKPVVTIAVFDPEKSLNSGIAGGVITMDNDKRLLSFIEGKEKKVKGYVNAGVYILEPEVLDLIPAGIFSDFGNDIFPKLLIQGKLMKGYITDSFVLAIDTQEALNTSEKNIKGGMIKNDYNQNTL